MNKRLAWSIIIFVMYDWYQIKNSSSGTYIVQNQW
jgi:hypothetical protein